jgi:hypothetical protein
VFDLLLVLMLNRQYPQNLLTDVDSPLAGGIQTTPPDSNSPTSSSSEYLTAPVSPSSPLPTAPNEVAGAEPMSTTSFQRAKDFELNDCNFYDIGGNGTFNNYASVKYLSFATLYCSHLVLRAQLSKSYLALRPHTTTTHARSRVVPALAAPGEVS